MARKTGTFLAVAALALGLAEPALGADEADVAPAAQPPAPADPIGSVTQGVVAPVTQVVQDTVQQTTGAVSQTTDAVGGVVTQTTDTVSRTTDSVGDTARPVVDRTTDTVARTVAPVADDAGRGAADRGDEAPAPSSSDSPTPALPPLRGGASSAREGGVPHATPESSAPAPAATEDKPERESSAPIRPDAPRWQQPLPVGLDTTPGSDVAVSAASLQPPDGGASTGTRPRRDVSEGFSGHAGHGGPSAAGASGVAASAAGSGPMLLLAFIGLCFGAACVLRRLQLVQITRSGDAFSLLLERPG